MPQIGRLNSFTPGEQARGWWIDPEDPRNKSTSYQGRSVLDMNMGNYRTPIPGADQQGQTQTNPALSPYANSEVSGQLADLFKQNSGVTTKFSGAAPNQFSGAMGQYLSSGAPSAPYQSSGAMQNPFGGAMGQYLGTRGPSASYQSSGSMPSQSQFSGALNKYIATGGPSAPTNNGRQPSQNQFGDAINQYLASGGSSAPNQSSAPVVQADVAWRNQQQSERNSFANQLQNHFATEAPRAQTARMGSSRFTGQLAQSEQRLQDLISNPSALQDSASYKFRVQQGQEALQRSLGAKGMLRSGNRLQDLTKYGQDMGSQEYEAENARRMAMYSAVSGNYNADQATAVNAFNARQSSMDRQYATAADLYKARGTTLAGLYETDVTNATNRYGIDSTANTNRGNMLADLYKSTAADATNRYGIDSTANTNRGNMLANLYGIDTTAGTQRYGIDSTANTARYGIDSTAGTNRMNTLADLYKSSAADATQRYGIDSTANTSRFNTQSQSYDNRGSLLANLYSNQNQADTARYASDTQRYGIDATAGTNRMNTLADLYKTDAASNQAWNQNQLGWAENERQKVTPQAWWTKYDSSGRPLRT